MSQIPEVNPAAAPVSEIAPTSTASEGASIEAGLVKWAPIGIVMSVTFALLQLMNEVGSLMVVPLYGSMSAELHLTPVSVSWTLLGTTIASAASLGLIVRLADNYGPRKLLFITLSLVTIGFALSALAPNLGALVVGRVLVGLTAAPSLCLAILNNRLSPADQKRGIGIITGGLALAVFAGFFLGGILLQVGVSWRAAFWIAAALTLVSMIGLIWTPESDVSQRSNAKLDLGGVLFLGIALTAFCIGFSEVSTWGWTSPLSLSLIIGGIVVGAVWVFWESRYPDPIADPRYIVDRRIMPAIGTEAVIGFVAFFLYQLVSNYVQANPKITGYGFGLTPLLAGLVLLPVTVGGLITSRTTPWFLKRYRARNVFVLGSIVFSVGFLWLLFFHSEIWQYEVGIMLFGMSVTTTINVCFAVLTAEAPKERAAGVTGLYMVLSTVAVSIGTAVYAALQGAGTVTVKGATFVTAGTFNTSYLVIFLVSLLGILLAFLLPKNSKANPDTVQ